MFVCVVGSEVFLVIGNYVNLTIFNFPGVGVPDPLTPAPRSVHDLCIKIHSEI